MNSLWLVVALALLGTVVGAVCLRGLNEDKDP
jgi:hypothetical protein